MKQGAPWSIKGVDADAREVAKAKATAAGMTLGQWLNKAIADADRPAPPPPPTASGTGSALDTARLMRAIAEVARRVDQIRPSDDAPAVGAFDSGPLEQRISDLAASVDLLAHRETPAIPQPPSLAPLEQRLDAIAARLEQLEQLPAALHDLANRPAPESPAPDMSSLAPKLEEQAQDLRRIMNGLINLGRKIDLTEQKVAERLAPLEARLAALDEKSDGNAGADLAAVAAALQRIEAGRTGASPEPASAPEPVAETAEAAEAAATSGPGPEPVTATPPAPEPIPEPEPDPEPAPPPESLAALHDLTARRDTIASGPTVRREPVFHDLPPLDGAPEPESDDDRPDFGAPPAGPAPEAARQAEPEPDSFASFPDSEPVAAPHAEPEPVLPRDSRPVGYDSLSGSEGLPDDALPPDRPRRLVNVESLLEGGERGPTPEADEEEWRQVPAAAGGAPEPRLRIPEPARREFQPPPPPREEAPRVRRSRPEPVTAPPRRGGYLIAALLILGLLVGGFLVAGSPVVDEIASGAGEVIGIVRDSLTDDSATTGDATPATATSTTDASTIAPAMPAAARPAPEKPAPAAPPAPAPAGTTGTPAPAPQPMAATEPSAPVTPPQVATPAPAPAPAPAPTPAPVAAPAPSATPVSEIATLRDAAEGGDAAAQFRLGLRYRDGDGVAQSYTEAARWFMAAANQGHVDAQMNLGVMYRQGVGVPKSIDDARIWLHAAAREGHAEAQKYLGEVYAQDDQGTPDYFQAARWFSEAAQQGVVDAQYNMGVLYEGGLGVPRDIEQAYYWFGLAARLGDSVAAEDQSRLAVQIEAARRAALDGRIAAFQAVQAIEPGTIVREEQTSVAGGNRTEITRRDQIRELQMLLVARGYDPGTPDGLPGERTREAIRRFQSDRGLAVDGRITETVLQQLKSGA